MRRRTPALAAVLLLALLACGCSQLLPDEPGPAPQVTRQHSEPVVVPTLPPRSGPPSQTWYLVAFGEGPGAAPVLPGTTVTAFFDGQGTVSGTAGCNRYTAACAGDRANLTIGPPVVTERSCSDPAGAMDQEARYLSALQRARSYTADGGLTIRDGQGTVVLTFSGVPNGTPVPAPLAGTTWYVHSFADGPGAARSPRGLTTIRLVFAPDGNLYGNAGCNNLFGPYTTGGGGAVRIGDLRATRVHCGIAGVMDLESTFLGLLPRMTRYSIDGDALRLSDAEGTAAIVCGTSAP